MEVSINERINSNLYSDVINSYVDINSVTSARNIVPGSFKHTVSQCTDLTLATLNSVGGQTMYTRLKLTPEVRNATLLQLAQAYFQYVIPKNSLGIILKKYTSIDAAENNDSATTENLNSIAEHIKFKLNYDTGFSIASMVNLCLSADSKVSTENFNYQQALITLNSLPDFATDNSTSESTLKALVHNEHYRGVGSGLIDLTPTSAATPSDYQIKFNGTTGLGVINCDIGIEGNIDLNKGNPLFHNFPVVTRNMGELYLRLFMENFLRELKVVYLNKCKVPATATANVSVPSGTEISGTYAESKLTLSADLTVASGASITAAGGANYLPYQRLPVDKPDFIYLDGSLYKIKLINIQDRSFSGAVSFKQTIPIRALTNISWKRLEIHKIEFDIEDYEDIKASQAKAGTYKFPVHLFRSKPFDQTNAASSSSNALQTTLQAPNIDRIFITQPLIKDYYTFLPTLTTTDINPQLHNSPVLPRTEDTLNARTCERIYSVFIDTDKHTPGQDLVSSTDVPTQNKQLWLKSANTYGGAGAFCKLQRGITTSTTPYLLPNKFVYALELNEGGCFRRGFNSVIDGHYSPTVPVNLSQSLQTSDDIYWSSTYNTSPTERNAVSNDADWCSVCAYGNITESGATASIHCLCDYIFWMNFDTWGNLVDFGVSEYNDRN